MILIYIYIFIGDSDFDPFLTLAGIKEIVGVADSYTLVNDHPYIFQA